MFCCQAPDQQEVDKAEVHENVSAEAQRTGDDFPLGQPNQGDEDNAIPDEPGHSDPAKEQPVHMISEEQELFMWECAVDDPRGDGLGAEVQNWHPNRIQVVRLNDYGSALASYNQEAPLNKRVEAFDVILSVNDANGQAAMKQILKGSGEKQVLNLTIARPKKLEIEIARDSADVPWGLDVEYLPSNSGLFVKGIIAGKIVDQYNKEQETADMELRVGDTIIELDGQDLRGGAEAGRKMLHHMKTELLCPTITVARIVAAYTLYYHTACKGFTARAFSPMCIMEAAGVKYEVVTPDQLPKGSAALFPPQITFPDGSTISQTGAICIALGYRLGLAPAGAAQRRKALQLVNDAGDLLSDCSSKKGGDRIMQWLNHFEKALGDKTFFMGEECTFVDYTVAGAIIVISLKLKKGSEDVKGVELKGKVKAWCARMGKDPVVKKVKNMAPFLPESML